jgi:hypothetical protein
VAKIYLNRCQEIKNSQLKNGVFYWIADCKPLLSTTSFETLKLANFI